MTNNTKSILAWAVNFFSSVKVTDQSIVSTKPEHEYDVNSAPTSLKFLLQDSGVSRIPPDCQLPHQHYRNPDIFEGDTSWQQYQILEKVNRNGYYCEYYVRQERHTGFYYAGVEAIKSELKYTNDYLPDSRISRDMPLFSLDVESSLYKKAVALVLPFSEELEVFRAKYLEHEKQSKQFIDDILNTIK